MMIRDYNAAAHGDDDDNNNNDDDDDDSSAAAAVDNCPFVGRLKCPRRACNICLTMVTMVYHGNSPVSLLAR